MEETAKQIRRVFETAGYVIDTHTAVGSCVYGKYAEETGDRTPAVIASTASPYKFTRSVMEALGEDGSDADDFVLADRLSTLSGTRVPQAVENIRTAPVLHDTVVSREKMQEAVLSFLGI